MLEELHNYCYAAHLGVLKTISALLGCVWWPNLALDVSALLLVARYVNVPRM